MADRVSYSDSLAIRCQPEITEAVNRAAHARGTKPSEYVRQAVLTGLRLDGFDPASLVDRDGAGLYESRSRSEAGG